MRLITGRDNSVNYDDAPAARDSIAASPQDTFADVIGPIMQDAFEHVEICTDGNRLKEIATNDIAAICDAGFR